MPSNDRPRHRRALAGLLLADVYWALSFPLAKAVTLLHLQLAPGVGTWFVTAATLAPRYLLATVVIVAWRRRDLLRMTPREWEQGLVMAGFAGCGLLLQTDGLQYTPASTSSFLTQLTAVLIPAWLAIRHRHIPAPLVWLGAALVLTGAAILGHLDRHALRLGRGEAETLGGAVFFTGQIVALGPPRYAANRVAAITFVMFAGQTIVFAALAAAAAPSAGAFAVVASQPSWWGFIAVLALACTVGATLLMNRWQPFITATEAGLMYALEPVFASVFALFLPFYFSRWSGIAYANEHATWTLVGGGGLITLANLLVHLRPAPADEDGRAQKV